MVDSQDNEVTNPIISLPNGTKSFEAEGKKFIVMTEIPVGRYRHYMKMEVELGFTVNFGTIVDNLVAAYNALNESRNADAAVLIKNTLEGCTHINEKRSIALWVATLFVNLPDEDLSEWSRDVAEQKIEAWKNIDANFFLGVALSRVNDFASKYKQIAQMMSRVGEIKERIQGSIEE